MFTGVLITTSGTIDRAYARHIGDAVRECIQQSKKTPTVVGFIKLSNVEHSNDIQEQCHDIGTLDQQVRCRQCS